MNLLGIIGEARSDVDTLVELVKRIKGAPNLTIKKKGFNGCAEMLVKSAKHISMLSNLGCTQFIICYDSDGKCQDDRKNIIIEKIIKPSGVSGEFCALVPVQEIEAWILADLSAVSKVISSFRPDKAITSPELIQSPKEHLERLTRKDAKPLYTNAVHNQKIAQHLDLQLVNMKCPSFRPLFEIATNGKGNV